LPFLAALPRAPIDAFARCTFRLTPVLAFTEYKSLQRPATTLILLPAIAVDELAVMHRSDDVGDRAAVQACLFNNRRPRDVTVFE